MSIERQARIAHIRAQAKIRLCFFYTNQSHFMLKTLWNRLERMNPILFVLTMLIASYLIVMPWALVRDWIPGFDGEMSGPKTMFSSGLLGRVVIGSIVVPVFETLINQWLPTWLLRRRFKWPWRWVLLCSALLFSAGHGYSPAYIVFAFLLGLLLAYAYAIQYEKKEGMPFILTYVIHALRNGIASLLIASPNLAPAPEQIAETCAPLNIVSSPAYEVQTSHTSTRSCRVPGPATGLG